LFGRVCPERYCNLAEFILGYASVRFGPIAAFLNCRVLCAMLKVIDLPLDEDIQALYRLLQARGVRVLVVEESGVQALYADNEEQASVVKEAYRQYREDVQVNQKVDQFWQTKALSKTPQLQIWPTLLASPMVSLLLFSLIFVGVWTGFGHFDSYRDFLIVDHYSFEVTGADTPLNVLMQLITEGHILRLLAPAWLHWSVFHWLFNSLGLWILGRQLEKILGSAGLLLLVLVSAMVANVSQFLVSGAGFGGFSGVVFALVGAHAVGILMDPRPGVWAHKGIVGMSVIWMFAAMMGVTEVFGVYVANTAHFTGFVSGIIWLAIAIKWGNRQLKQQQHDNS